MNKKMICVAVASTLSATTTYADITPYARINNAIDIQDSGDGNTVDLSGVYSRFGFKGSGDIGNGLTAIGRYEFETNTDRELDNVKDLRIGYVGLSGGFGTVTLGQQWSAYFNSVGTLVSPTYSLGFFLYSSVAGGVFRGSNTVKYANTFGPVSIEADLRLNESEEDGDVAEKINGDGYGIGVSLNPVENLTIALAFDSEENNSLVDEDSGAISPVEDTERSGIAAKTQFGPVGATLGYQNVEQGASSEIESMYLWLSGQVGEKTSVLVGFSQADTGVAEPNQLTIGIYHKLGGGLRLWTEAMSLDYDDGSEDFNKILLGMRIDF